MREQYHAVNIGTIITAPSRNVLNIINISAILRQFNFLFSDIFVNEIKPNTPVINASVHIRVNITGIM